MYAERRKWALFDHGQKSPEQRHPGEAVVKQCFPNVEARVVRAGGRMLCGWQLWEWPHVLIEAGLHAVWLSPDGEMVDLTPKPHSEARILFLPDKRRRYDGIAGDNVRMPLRDDQVIPHFIRAAEAITRVMNRGERISQHGQVSVPRAEIAPLLRPKGLGESIASGLRDHDPCLCDSGGKCKR